MVAACSGKPHAPAEPPVVTASIDAASAVAAIARNDGGTWLCPKNDWDECKTRCDAGNALSCARWGSQLYSGASDWHRDAKLEMDRAAARVAMQRSCDLGYPRACATLGLIVGRDLDTELEDGERKDDFGGPKDEAAAIALYRRACDGEVAMGCAMVGRHVPAEEQAMTDRACALGDAEACVDRGGARDDDDLHGALSDFHRALSGAPVGSKLAAARVACAAGTTAVETRGDGFFGGPETYCASADGKKEGPAIEWLSDEDLAEGPPHGVMRWELGYHAGARTGHAKKYGDDGSIVGEGDFRSDKEQGPWVLRSEGGEERGSFVDGERDGAWVEEEAGHRSEGSYSHDKKIGTWTEYIDGDVVFRVVHYEAGGKQDGDDTRTWPNGQKCVSHHTHGKESGVRTCWMHGHKTLEMPFGSDGQPDGVMREWDDDDGHLSQVGTYRDGVKIGKWKLLDAHGKTIDVTDHGNGDRGDDF
ncbi:MAG TPA: hypothetical protein VL463_11670 [Kofleriaceae bacterium]|nr:hypothetical protein [Kofleriaceae bacterium]